MIESIFFNPWIWILAVIIGILVLSAIGCVVGEFVWGGYGDGWMPAGFLALIAALVAGLYFGAVLPPYDASFYQTYRITGTLEQLDSALEGDNGTMSQVFIAQVGGIDEFIRSDDQRFRTLRVDDSIDFVCTKGFAYFQEPWYDCAIGSTGPR